MKFTRKFALNVLFIFVLLFALNGCKPIGVEETPSLKDVINDKETQKEEKTQVEEIVYNEDDFISVEETNVIEYFKPPTVKGIYISGHAAGIDDWMDNLITLADETELNSFVIDIKDDDGYVTYEMDNDVVKEIGAFRGQIDDIGLLLDKLYEHDIYPIARIVTFKDPYLAKNVSEYAIKNKGGGLWKYKGIPWINPYNKDSWDYILDVASRAGLDGFKEIQFDYIRFEATESLNNATFEGLEEGKTRQDVILDYVDYAVSRLSPLGLKVSADVFGTIITSERDAKNIGQDYKKMANKIDVICPMVYPSHYGFGFYGIPAGKHSDLYPYEIIKGSMDDSTELLKGTEPVAIVRPWLQAFTASYLGAGNYMTYGKEAIRAQIQASYDAGLEEWILWHAGVKYNDSYLLKE